MNKPVLGGLAVMMFGLMSCTQAQEAVIKIGLSSPLTGPQASAGKDNQNGLTLAIEELNAKGVMIDGKKAKFELVAEDDQADPKQGVAVAQKLVDSQVKAVVGPYNSGVTIPASRVYNDAGLVVATVASNPKITEQGYKNLFRVAASDSALGAKMAEYAAKVLKLKTVAILDDRTAYGQGLAQEFEKAAKTHGLQIVGHEYTTDKATDFSAVLTNFKSKKPQAIFYGGYAPQGGPLARQMKTLGLTAKLLGGDGICSPEMGKIGGDAVGDNVMCTQSGAMLDKVANGPAFATKFQKRFNIAPEVYAISFYDAMMLVAHSMQEAKSSDPAKYAEVMRQSSFKGVAGEYSFDAKGDLKSSPVTVYSFKNGLPVALASF